jgi:hypothetical protein
MHTELPLVTFKQYCIVQIVFLFVRYILEKVDYFCRCYDGNSTRLEEKEASTGFHRICILTNLDVVLSFF